MGMATGAQHLRGCFLLDSVDVIEGEHSVGRSRYALSASALFFGSNSRRIVSFWDAISLCGYPFLANTEVAAWYLPHWPFILAGVIAWNDLYGAGERMAAQVAASQPALTRFDRHVSECFQPFGFGADFGEAVGEAIQASSHGAVRRRPS
jgi:hypothetical protein